MSKIPEEISYLSKEEMQRLLDDLELKTLLLLIFRNSFSLPLQQVHAMKTW